MLNRFFFLLFLSIVIFHSFLSYFYFIVLSDFFLLTSVFLWTFFSWFNTLLLGWSFVKYFIFSSFFLLPFILVILYPSVVFCRHYEFFLLFFSFYPSYFFLLFAHWFTKLKKKTELQWFSFYSFHSWGGLWNVLALYFVVDFYYFSTFIHLQWLSALITIINKLISYCISFPYNIHIFFYYVFYCY